MNINTENILAIDAGNTRVKWGLFSATGIMLDHGVCLNTALATAVLPKATRVIISNVAGSGIQLQLKNLLSSHLLSNSTAIHWASAQSIACGVVNHYDKPVMLGSDRWAALIAAWHI